MKLLSYLKSHNLTESDFGSNSFKLISKIWDKINWDDDNSLKQCLLDIQNIINIDLQIEINKYEKDTEYTEEELPEVEFGSEIKLRPVQIQGKKFEKIINEQNANDTIVLLKNNLNYKVVSVDKKVVRVKPKPPFTTSSLQQASQTFLGYSPKLTMQLAQKLYEGIDFNGENTALITYMRTDSVNLSKESIEKIRGYIQQSFSKDYLPLHPIIYKAKSRNAQEAHEAIRPTNPLLLPSGIKFKISDNRLWRLYELIWKQSICCQMSDNERYQTTFNLENIDKTIFTGTVTSTKFLGWKVLFEANNDFKNELVDYIETMFV
jgi:DNA topoisomerase I